PPYTNIAGMSSPFIASFALFIQIAGFRCCCEEWESIPLKWWVAKLRNESAQLLRRAEAAQRLQSCRRLRDCRLVARSSCHAGFPIPGNSELGGALGHRAGRDRIPNRTHYRLGLRAHSGRNPAHRRSPSPKRKQFEKSHLDLCRRDWSRHLCRIVFHRALYRPANVGGGTRTSSRGGGTSAAEIDRSAAIA